VRNYLFFLLFLPLPFVSFFRPWIGMLIWGWLSLLNPHRDLYGFASTLPYNQVIAAATLAGWLVSGEFRKFRLDLTAALLILLWVLMTISTIFSLAPERSWPKWDEFSKIILYALVLQSFLTTKARIHALIWLLVLCLGFYGVKGGALFLLSGGTSEFTGPRGTIIEDRNQIAIAILMVIPLMNYLRLQSAHRWIHVGLLTAMLLSVLAVIGTYSRGGFIGLVVLGLMIWLRSRHKLSGLLIAGAIAVVVVQVAPAKWRDRMSTIQTADKDDDSFKGRLIAWQTYFEAARARPLIGAGPYALNSADVFFRYQPYETGVDFENKKPRAAHSIYFQILGEMGFIAFLIYTLLALKAVCDLIWLQLNESTQHNSISSFTAALQTSLASFFVAGAAASMALYDVYLIALVLIPAARRVRSLSSAAKYLSNSNREADYAAAQGVNFHPRRTAILQPTHKLCLVKK
jgi:probable O-glycosylation ligase (exosortase A-associated)